MFKQENADRANCIRYHDMTIPYEICHSNRKSYAIQIYPGGRVVVRTPSNISLDTLQRLFLEKEQWIKKNYLKQCAVIGDTTTHSNPSKQEAALEKRYREAAKEYFPKRVEYYIAKTGGHYERIVIRGQKTRWGSCSSRGTLSFNWKLMLAPPRVLDYVVVHELCHLTHMNHAPAFWMAVELILPDYKELRKWLKDHGNSLQIE
ncbi:MAG: SprT family zinc-dependent metalloprotease [Lachnospiraceae bacterium]